MESEMPPIEPNGEVEAPELFLIDERELTEEEKQELEAEKQRHPSNYPRPEEESER